MSARILLRLALHLRIEPTAVACVGGGRRQRSADLNSNNMREMSCPEAPVEIARYGLVADLPPRFCSMSLPSG